jgi:hypothetical protein
MWATSQAGWGTRLGMNSSRKHVVPSGLGHFPRLPTVETVGSLLPSREAGLEAVGLSVVANPQLRSAIVGHPPT